MVRAGVVVAATTAAAASTASGSSVLLAGCNSLKLNEEGFAVDAEVMPMSQVSGTSVFYSISEPEDCRAKCAQNEDCAYFTLRESKATGERVCILRPPPSFATSPLFQVRIFDDSSLFRYSSGPSSATASCDDGQELIAGCGGSAPGSCALLGKHVSFNATCLSDGDLANHCGVQGFACCVDCDTAGGDACCGRDSRLQGYLLTGGLSVGGIPSGVRNAEECWARCAVTAGCTHWNFLSTEVTSSMEGGCYLRAYVEQEHPTFVKAPSFVSSVVGGADCNGDYGLVAPPASETTVPGESTPTAAEAKATLSAGLGGQAIPGSCFESGVDVIGANIYQKWGVPVAEDCQVECQKLPGCVGFVYDPAHTGCYMKFSFDSKVLATHDVDISWRYVTGPRDCPGNPKAPPPNNEDACIFTDWDIRSDDLTATPAGNVYECWQKCSFWDGCNGWTYFEDQCYLKTTVEPRVAAKGVVSGSRICEWPMERRLLVPEAIQHLKEERLEELSAVVPKFAAPAVAGDDAPIGEPAKKAEGSDQLKTDLRSKLDAGLDMENEETIDEEVKDEGTHHRSISVEEFEAFKKELLKEHPFALGAAQERESQKKAFASSLEGGLDVNTSMPPQTDQSTAAEECVLNNKDIRGPAIETLGAVETAEVCRQKCAEREDCFYAAYVAAEQECKIRYEGPVFEKMGTDLYARNCGTDREAVVAGFTEPALVGYSYHFLGTPSDWSVKGELPDFKAPHEWSRMALLVMTGDEQDCFISDILVNVKSCWDKHAYYLPLEVQLQIIGVARGAKFPGWSAISWDSRGKDTSKENGLIELFNQNLKITADADTIAGGHGVWISEVTDELTASWPKSMTEPINFRQGSFYARLRAFGERPVPSRVVFCITASDQPLSEICSFPLVVPPTEGK